MKFSSGLVVALLLINSCRSDAPRAVGPLPDKSGFMVPTAQLIRPAGQSIEFHGHPVDLLRSPDGKTVYVKDSARVLAIDAPSWTIREQLKLPPKAEGSMHGIAMSRDGSRLYVTCGPSALHEAKIGPVGKLDWTRAIDLKQPGAKIESYPCGIALLADEKTASVSLSTANALAEVDLSKGKVIQQIDVGMAPFDVVVDSEKKLAYVSNWGGRRPHNGDKTAKSAGSEIVVDDRGVASTGTVGVVDFAARRQIAEIAVGLHPCGLALSRDAKTLYVANANSDTVSVIDTAKREVTRTISTRPDDKLPFGSISNALALSEDEKTLYVANGNNNAIAVIDLLDSSGSAKGFIPAGWYPGA